MATSWNKITIPAFQTDDGEFDVIITKNNKRHTTVPESEHLRLTSYRYFKTSDIILSKFRDIDNRLVGSDIGEIELLNPFEYNGESDGSPVYENLWADGVNLFGNFFSDRTALYSLWVRRSQSGVLTEYPFSGDFKRKNVRFNDISIGAPSSTGEITSGTLTIKCSPAKDRLTGLLVSDFITTFTADDTPERGDGDTDHISQPVYGGIRYKPGVLGAAYTALPDGVPFKTVNPIVSYAAMETFDYALHFLANDFTSSGLGYAPFYIFPLWFWQVSIFKILEKIFSHDDIDIKFDASSYDPPAYATGFQQWNNSTEKYGDFWGDGSATAYMDFDEIYLNFNVLFGINPQPGRTYYGCTIDTGADEITTSTDHEFADDDIVYYFTAPGGMPGGISMWVPYYVVNSTSNTLQLSETEGGSPINITSAGDAENLICENFFIDTPNTIKQQAGVIEFVKRFCWQFGYYMEFGVVQSGADEGQTTIYFRERLQSPPGTFPNLTLTKEGSDEEPAQKPLILQVSHEGDEDNLFTPRLPEKQDDVLEVTIPWRVHALADVTGAIYWNHLLLNEKLKHEEQNQCMYERNYTEFYPFSKLWLIHPYSHALGTHLLRFATKDATNASGFLPDTYDEYGRHDQSNARTSFEGHHALNLVRRYPDSGERFECVTEFMTRYYATDLLRGEFGLKRLFDGVTDGSDSIAGMTPLMSYSTRRDGATRNYYTDKLKLFLKARKTEAVFEEQPANYDDLTPLPIFRKNGGGVTSGGSRSSSGGNQTGGTASVDISVAGNSHLPIYGDGSNGSVDFDGSTTILGLVPAASVYTMDKDIFCININVQSGVTLNTNGYRIFGTGTLTNAGTIHNNGNPGVGFVAGTATSSGNSLGSGAAGGTGGNAGNGAAGSNSTTSGGGAGAAGGNSGAGQSAGAAGTVTAPGAQYGGSQIFKGFYPTRITGLLFSGSGNAYANGGAGGSGGGGQQANSGGGGGSGGGSLLIASYAIVNTGTISANGGDGGNGGGVNSGGGGGGGGGIVYLIYHSKTNTGDITAAGGVGGALQGTGSNGSDGSPGNVLEMVN